LLHPKVEPRTENRRKAVNTADNWSKREWRFMNFRHTIEHWISMEASKTSK